MKPKSFNDFLAILLDVFVIPSLWIFSALVKELPLLVLGATVPVWTMIVQFYFRKAPPA